MKGKRRPAPVGRKTRRAPDLILALQQIRAGFEPGSCGRSNPDSDANTSDARLKPGAVGPVMIQRPERAEVFALPAPSTALHQ
jgi:hypothetical protein